MVYLLVHPRHRNSPPYLPLVLGFVGATRPLHPLLPSFREITEFAEQGPALHSGVGQEHGGRQEPLRLEVCDVILARLDILTQF